MARPTQEFVPIKEIHNNTVILNDGSLRAIIMVSSINFALKSRDEQSAIIYQFQNLLNTLDFPIQIYVQSRRLDIRPYLTLLKEREAAQTNELLRVQTREYIEYIRLLADSTNIMSKSFFVVVPYQGTANIPTASQVGRGFFAKNKKESRSEKERRLETVEELIVQLNQRVQIVEQGLIRTGVRTVRLASEELIELYYKLFNPGEVTTSANR